MKKKSATPNQKQSSLPPLVKVVEKETPSVSSKYLFEIDNYEVVKKLNNGSFGSVNLVKNKSTGEKLAAKTNFVQSKADQDYILREVNILIRVQHPTIIRFRGVSYKDFNGNANLTFLMDYMANGSLADLLGKEVKSLCPSDYSNTKRQIILVGIALGMMTLHNHFVIHRDLKPENILLDKNYHPCIADFGLSKFYDPQDSMKQSMSSVGTVAYMAPEVTESYNFNTKADVYSFGILMYEVITGTRAYDDIIQAKKLTPFSLTSKIAQGLRPKFKCPIKKGLKSMIERCWSSNPQERPTFREIFLKLSLSQNSSIAEFAEDFDNSELSNNNDDTINLDFCLEDVDTDEVLLYVDEIMDANNTSNKGGSDKDKDELIKKQAKTILELKKENEDLKKQLSQLKKKLNSKSSESASQEPKIDKKTTVKLHVKSPDEAELETKTSISTKFTVKQPQEPNNNLSIRKHGSTDISSDPNAKGSTIIKVSASNDVSTSSKVSANSTSNSISASSSQKVSSVTKSSSPNSMSISKESSSTTKASKASTSTSVKSSKSTSNSASLSTESSSTTQASITSMSTSIKSSKSTSIKSSSSKKSTSISKSSSSAAKALALLNSNSDFDSDQDTLISKAVVGSSTSKEVALSSSTAVTSSSSKTSASKKSSSTSVSESSSTAKSSENTSISASQSTVQSESSSITKSVKTFTSVKHSSVSSSQKTRTITTKLSNLDDLDFDDDDDSNIKPILSSYLKLKQEILDSDEDRDSDSDKDSESD